MINNINNMMSPNARMERTWGMIVVGVVSAGVGLYQSSQNRKAAEEVGDTARQDRLDQQDLLEKQKKKYKAMKFTNPFANMENVYEDITVNQQQAQFQAQQGAQQRANIMSNLKGAAGSSGVAGLAQAMAGQGQLQTQRISASIGAQESRNQMAAAKGAGAVQIAERQGDQWVQQLEQNRQATLLGMQMGEATGANLAYQQSQTNEMNAQIAQQQSTADMLGVVGQAAGQVNWGGGGSGLQPKTQTASETEIFGKGNTFPLGYGIPK